jgi:o-succinylbenzoate synthase
LYISRQKIWRKLAIVSDRWRFNEYKRDDGINYFKYWLGARIDHPDAIFNYGDYGNFYDSNVLTLGQFLNRQVNLTIQSLTYQSYRLNFREPFRTAKGVLNYREGFIIEIRDRQNLIGLGEAATLDGFGMESLAETEIALQAMQRSLINAEISNLSDIEELVKPCDRTPAAKHGLELALLNLFARSQNLTLPQLLTQCFGGKIRQFVPINAVIGAIAPETAALKAQTYIQEGYRCLKIKVGTGNFEADWQRVAAVRSQVGNDIQIRIDANQAWTVDEAIANLKKLESLNLEYVEQPVAALDLAGLAKVKQSQSIAIAADESVNNLAQLQQVINAQTADIIILKPMALGGILTAHKAALAAFNAGLDVVVTTTIDGAIARQAAYDLAAALPITRACGLASGSLFA